MNFALKSSTFNPQSRFFNLRAALFHSTPVLQRKSRSHWHTPRSHHNSNFYSKRFRRTQSKQSLLRNISAFADHLFQSWQEEINDDDPSASRGTSWFKKDYGRSKQTQYQGHQGRGRRDAWIFEEIDEDEGFVDVERVFESIFGRRQHSHWSFTYEDNTGRRSSSSYGYNYWDHHHWRSRDQQNWRSRVEEDYEFEEESESSELDMASHRQALGLSASGPLKLEDVKIAQVFDRLYHFICPYRLFCFSQALLLPTRRCFLICLISIRFSNYRYRACALKWHPDRHQGSSKVVAEEKFKRCSAAYQSLCDKLAAD